MAADGTTDIGREMTDLVQTHPSLLYLLTIFVAVVFFIFGLYGLNDIGMIYRIYLMFLLMACATGITVHAQSNIPDTASYIENPGPYGNYYIIIADTGNSYNTLQQQMYRLGKRAHLPIDTMSRYYNREKDLIALPDNYEDDIYAGSYYQRRYTSVFLSLEYLNYYKQTAPDKTIALVAGIYANNSEAKKALTTMKRHMPRAFMLKSRIYTGCMH